MPEIKVRDTEHFEGALRRFKKAVEKAGIINDLRARESYEKPTTERKRKLAQAVKRHYRRTATQLTPKRR